VAGPRPVEERLHDLAVQPVREGDGDQDRRRGAAAGGAARDEEPGQESRGAGQADRGFGPVGEPRQGGVEQGVLEAPVQQAQDAQVGRVQGLEHVTDLGRGRVDAGEAPAGAAPANLGRERLPGALPEGKASPRDGVTLFVPVYNEEAILAETMPRLLRVAEELGRDLQLVIVDNGSTDATPAVLARLAEADPRIEVLRLPRPGVGAAMRAALPRLRHRLVLAIDADLTIDLGFVADAVRALDEGADAVIGNKDAGEQHRPPLRLVTSKVFTWVMTRGAGFPYHDVSIGAKGYRRSVLRRFEDRIGTGSKYVLEVLMAAHDAGLRIVEVPVACRDERESRFNLLHEGVHRFGHLFGLVLRRRLPALRLPRPLRRPAVARRRTAGASRA
jgi:hypothetical protein